MTEAELKRRKIRTLPRTLLEAVEAFAADDIGKRVFGQELYDTFIDLKTKEWWAYHNTVSNWEIEQYLVKW